MSITRSPHSAPEGAYSPPDGKDLLLSVVVPVHGSAALLERSLASILASDLPRGSWELLVVDDASADESPQVAGGVADMVVRLPAPARGPAYARNRGFELARGRFVAFVNADVAVRPATLRELVERLLDEPAVAAVSASYDTTPAAPGFVSRYRNLMRHHDQRVMPAERAELWAGCCVVRPAAFAAAGLFNEWHFARPSVEAAELTARLRQLGAEVSVEHGLPVTHLRGYTLGEMLRDDLHVRRLEHARVLAGRRSGLPPRVPLVMLACESLVWAAFVSITIAVADATPAWAVAAAWMLGGVVLLEAPVHLFFLRTAGVTFVLGVVPLRLLSHAVHGAAHLAGSLLRHTVGEPRPDPTVEAWVEMGVQTWPPMPARRLPAAPRVEA